MENIHTKPLEEKKAIIINNAFFDKKSFLDSANDIFAEEDMDMDSLRNKKKGYFESVYLLQKVGEYNQIDAEMRMLLDILAKHYLICLINTPKLEFATEQVDYFSDICDFEEIGKALDIDFRTSYYISKTGFREAKRLGMSISRIDDKKHLKVILKHLIYKRTDY